VGPLWWVHSIYGWCLAFLACFQLALSARQLRHVAHRFRRVALSVSGAVPLLANLVYVHTGAPGLDPTPMLLAAWLVGLRSDLFSGDLLQALPVVQHDLVSQLPTPLILTDRGGRVTEINPAAQASLGVLKADALDRHIEALLEGAAFAPEFDRWPLVAQGQEAGSILLPAAEKRSRASAERPAATERRSEPAARATVHVREAMAVRREDGAGKAS
jgi:PAS domain-containing protein